MLTPLTNIKFLSWALKEDYIPPTGASHLRKSCIVERNCGWRLLASFWEAKWEMCFPVNCRKSFAMVSKINKHSSKQKSVQTQYKIFLWYYGWCVLRENETVNSSLISTHRKAPYSAGMEMPMQVRKFKKKVFQPLGILLTPTELSVYGKKDCENYTFFLHDFHCKFTQKLELGKF